MRRGAAQSLCQKHCTPAHARWHHDSCCRWYFTQIFSPSAEFGALWVLWPPVLCPGEWPLTDRSHLSGSPWRLFPLPTGQPMTDHHWNANASGQGISVLWFTLYNAVQYTFLCWWKHLSAPFNMVATGSLWLSSTWHETKEMNFKFVFILINFHLNSYTWLVATILDNADPEPHMYQAKDRVCLRQLPYSSLPLFLSYFTPSFTCFSWEHNLN